MEGNEYAVLARRNAGPGVSPVNPPAPPKPLQQRAGATLSGFLARGAVRYYIFATVVWLVVLAAIGVTNPVAFAAGYLLATFDLIVAIRVR